MENTVQEVVLKPKQIREVASTDSELFNRLAQEQGMKQGVFLGELLKGYQLSKMDEARKSQHEADAEKIGNAMKLILDTFNSQAANFLVQTDLLEENHRNKIDILQSLNKKKTDELNDLQNNYNKSGIEITNLRDDIVKLEKDKINAINTVEAEKNALINENSEQIQEIEQLRGELSELAGDLKRSERLGRMKDEELAELKAELTAANELANKTEEIERLLAEERKNHEQSIIKERHDAELAAVKTELALEKAKNEIEKLTYELERAKEEARRTNAESDRLLLELSAKSNAVMK
ncbi:MAG: hypothetical protein LBV67_01215 [Streptococcaceae bacterium]|jgi:chromosome segregation ATPase|nr:hypothetical protein [Streptococcaceae bacterium]